MHAWIEKWPKTNFLNIYNRAQAREGTTRPGIIIDTSSILGLCSEVNLLTYSNATSLHTSVQT